ncbi:bifunctional 4-hydroxy-2-oxoglutarate aldolase/2-dehydro-3-deoxy-phosphogluconate aldolase [Flammeovirga sp. MY04]|uniref:bifunctional 4-hydroxy-2-oxoglutarate aldolase/2-dehydro-3-deoxy-phosphogluconate aldolase n=1 Tax=Flammeovirga sp. MY04 TaxID=1191459 RepID=UPI0008063824|nr:bifunctional 4-hydroxy-2-oxoglutarate aldolase/2-dehydro-3-deoxy-phosphogluconate aldolase [Flammeovirga sp. MY04]ANQ52712.1 bifunctional 4-hydroxy-2-oxoglutarate aldolase/2-dehydro-3-deoxy-phosphogluconate aldolase [Flammeovirga sp. MY04]
MNQQTFSWEKYKQTPIIGILRGESINNLERMMQAYEKAGFSSIEITMNTDGVEEQIQFLSKQFPNLNVGAGTVCSLQDVLKAVDAGAQFIVTPIINKEVIVKCKELNLPIFAGAFTPSEIYAAWDLGVDAVKLFPNMLGIQYIKEIMAPLDTIKLVPTGGVHQGNIKEYFDLGVYGVGMGSALFPKELRVEGQEEALYHHLLDLKKQISNVSI